MDLIQQSNIWLENQRHDLLTSTVELDLDGTIYSLDATQGKSMFEEVTSDNVVTPVTTTDFIFRKSDLVRMPKEGDTITVQIGDTTYVYEVKAYEGKRAYSSDNYKLSTRVRTVLIRETVGTITEQYYFDDAGSLPYYFDDAQTIPFEVQF